MGRLEAAARACHRAAGCTTLGERPATHARQRHVQRVDGLVELMVMEVAVFRSTCSQAEGPFETVPPV
jgi:hypothetical protein